MPSALKSTGVDSVFVGIVGSEFAAALNHFGVDETELPVVVVLGNADAEDKRKFKSSLTTFTADAIAKFVKDASEGRVPAFVKSEPLPSSNDGAVKIVTGNTVQEIVLDDSKDVLLEVYAPWCGHCKSLEPIYESVALAFANEPRVVVAKLDGTKNDFNLHPVQGFPTLLVFPAHSKTARPVQGRDARALINAVISNSAFQDLKVDMNTLPKSGVVPQALAEMFPMLEEGVLALQSNVLFGPFTAFHFIAGAVVIFFGFMVMMLRAGPPKIVPPAPVAPPTQVPSGSASAAAQVAPAASADVATAAATGVAEGGGAVDPAATTDDPTLQAGLRPTRAGASSQTVDAASPKAKKSSKTTEQKSS